MSSGLLFHLYLYSTLRTRVFTALGASSVSIKFINSSILSGVGRAIQKPLTGSRESSLALTGEASDDKFVAKILFAEKIKAIVKRIAVR